MHVKHSVLLSNGEAKGCAVGWGRLCSSLFPLVMGMTPEVGWHFLGLQILETLPWVCSVHE